MRYFIFSPLMLRQPLWSALYLDKWPLACIYFPSLLRRFFRRTEVVGPVSQGPIIPIIASSPSLLPYFYSYFAHSSFIPTPLFSGCAKEDFADEYWLLSGSARRHACRAGSSFPHLRAATGDATATTSSVCRQHCRPVARCSPPDRLKAG